MKAIPMRALVAPMLAAVALVAAACGSADESLTATETVAPADGPILAADVLTGQATTIDGESFELGSLAEKDLVVWFWAPW